MPLAIEHITKRFGGLVALDDVTLSMVEGEVTAVVGGNGAGKSTLFNIVGGHIRPDRGGVFMSRPGFTNGSRTELTGMAPFQIARRGVGMLFQSVRLFEHLTVLDNVMTGFRSQPGESLWAALVRPSQAREQEQRNTAAAMSLLRSMDLDPKALQLAGGLSFGEQKLVAIARLLAGDARVLLFDEPTSGVHPAMVERILRLISDLAHNQGRIVVLIEHNPRVVDDVADTVHLLEHGVLAKTTRFRTGINQQQQLRDRA